MPYLPSGYFPSGYLPSGYFPTGAVSGGSSGSSGSSGGLYLRPHIVTVYPAGGGVGVSVLCQISSEDASPMFGRDGAELTRPYILLCNLADGDFFQVNSVVTSTIYSKSYTFQVVAEPISHFADSMSLTNYVYVVLDQRRYPQSIEIQSHTDSVDALGGHSSVWTTVVTVQGVLLTPKDTQETKAEQLQEVDVFALHLPRGTAIDSTNRVRVNGSAIYSVESSDIGRGDAIEVVARVRRVQ